MPTLPTTPEPPAPQLLTHSVAAGFPSPADDYAEGALSLDQSLVHNPAFTFFVRARGDSMLGAGIFDGDLLVVDKSLEAHTGQVVIAVVNGELTVKRLARLRGQYALLAENPQFAPITFHDGEELQIWGVVTASIRRHL